MRRLLAVVAFAVMIVPLLPADAAQAQRQQRTSSQQSRQKAKRIREECHGPLTRYGALQLRLQRHQFEDWNIGVQFANRLSSDHVIGGADVM